MTEKYIQKKNMGIWFLISGISSLIMFVLHGSVETDDNSYEFFLNFANFIEDNDYWELAMLFRIVAYFGWIMAFTYLYHELKETNNTAIMNAGYVVFLIGSGLWFLFIGIELGTSWLIEGSKDGPQNAIEDLTNSAIALRYFGNGILGVASIIYGMGLFLLGIEWRKNNSAPPLIPLILILIQIPFIFWGILTTLMLINASLIGIMFVFVSFYTIWSIATGIYLIR